MQRHLRSWGNGTVKYTNLGSAVIAVVVMASSATAFAQRSMGPAEVQKLKDEFSEVHCRSTATQENSDDLASSKTKLSALRKQDWSAGNGFWVEETVGSIGLQGLSSVASVGDHRAQFLLSYLFLVPASAELFDVEPDEEFGLRLLRCASAGGLPLAQSTLGRAYLAGTWGIRKNSAEGLRLVRAAEAQGNAAAQFTLGAAYSNGEHGLRADAQKAVQLFRASAEQGNAGGQSALGVMYQTGSGGLAKDIRKARQLFESAAALGYGEAQARLGYLHQVGQGGLKQDERKAAELYTLAAKRGSSTAQTYLADMYERGAGGLPVSREEAIRLYRSAAAQGVQYAADQLVRLGATPSLNR